MSPIIPPDFGKFSSWDALPPRMKVRWRGIQGIVETCFTKGMIVHILPSTIGDVVDADYHLPAMWSSPAAYIPWLRTLVMTKPIAYGYGAYGTYRGDVHEVGHVVWSLLIPTTERWSILFKWWVRAAKERRLLDDYSASKAEEWFAQSWEAFWTKERDETGINWNRDDLIRVDPELYVWIKQKVEKFGGNPDQYATA